MSIKSNETFTAERRGPLVFVDYKPAIAPWVVLAFRHDTGVLTDCELGNLDFLSAAQIINDARDFAKQSGLIQA